MNINKNLLLSITFLLAVLVITPVAYAQGTGTNINDLMGERPANTYYQNSGSGAQTQGSSSTTSSAGASVLQLEPTATLTVDSPARTTTPVPAAKGSSAYKLFAVLAVIFLAVAIIIFLLGVKKQKATIRAEMVAKTPATEEVVMVKEAKVITAQTERTKAKKKHLSKAKRRKKKR